MPRHVPGSARPAPLPAALFPVALVTAVVAAGCTTPPVPDEAPAPTSVVVAVDEPVTGYNAATAAGAGAGSAGVVLLTGAGFTSVGPDGALREDPGFGTVEVLSQDPLRVRYEVAEGVTWSDGEAIDAGDLLLHWAALSGALDAGDAGDAGSAAVDAGPLAAVTALPEVDEDGRAVTLTWDSPSADWEGAFWDAARPGMPAHVVGARALGVEDPDEAEAAVVAALTAAATEGATAGGGAATTPETTATPDAAAPDAAASPDATAAPDAAATPDATAAPDAAATPDGAAADVAAIADVWSTAFTWSALPADADLHLASGPYVLTALDATQAVLQRREDARDPAPAVDEVVVRVVPDDAAAIAALGTGEVDVAALPADAATSAALAGQAGVTVEDTLTGARQLLLLRTSGALHPGVFEDPLVRRALLEVLPRQQAVTALVAPTAPSSRVLGSFLLDTWSPGYDAVAGANGSTDLEAPDAGAAAALLEQAGATAPEVCLLFDADDARQSALFALVRDAAAPAGFVVTDCSGARDRLGEEGAYDAALVQVPAAATGSADGSAAAASALYRSGGAAGTSGYANPVVDAVLDKLAAEPDAGERLALVARADAALWADGAGAPFYEVPGVTATSVDVAGVVTAPRGPGVFAGYEDWSVR